MTRLCNSVRTRPVLPLLLAAFALLNGRPTRDHFFPASFAGPPIALPSLTSESAAEESTDPLQAPPVSVSEARSESGEINDPRDSPRAETSPAQAADVETSTAQTSEVTFDWQEDFASRLSMVNSRIAVAQAGTAIVRYKVESERRIELAELSLQIATRNRNRYAEGESQRERALLENQVQLTRDGHQQLEERLAWSESLANGGLISQATLEIDDSAVKGSASELRVAEDRLTVFKTIELERSQTQLEARVLSAQAELELLKQNEKSKSQELQRNHVAAQHALDFMQARVEDLNGEFVAEVEPGPTGPVELSGLAKEVELARSAMLTAEQRLAAMKKQVNVASQNHRQLRKVLELQLEAFRKGRHAGALHELSSRIRTIAEGLASDQQQLTWSRRVIRKGYITDAELRSAELAVSKRKAELANVQQQKSILSEHTLKRDEFELKEKLRHASNELIRQERLATAQVKELNVTADAKRQAWEIRHETLAMLRGECQDAVAEAGGG